MFRKHQTAHGLHVSFGLLAAALALTLTGCSERSTSEPASLTTSEPDNRRQLSQAESESLIGWAKAVVTCMRAVGVDVGDPIPSPRQISMPLGTGQPNARILHASAECGEKLGDPPRVGQPPRGSSLVIPKGTPTVLLLYLPKQCLLDPTSVAG
jgi:hypothetical protein